MKEDSFKACAWVIYKIKLGITQTHVFFHRARVCCHIWTKWVDSGLLTSQRACREINNNEQLALIFPFYAYLTF